MVYIAHLLALLGTLAVRAAAAGEVGITSFAWDDIEPTADLRYRPCYDGYQCARLKVPLDWLDADNNASAVIAITTLPAVVSEDDESFGGTIITNPGGPGGSGVDHVLRFGRHLQAVVDRNKHYEILSFDPRGVGFTTPKADCFGGDVFKRDALALEKRGIGNLDSSQDALKRHFAVTGAYGRLCAQQDHSQDPLAYVSTPSVARDMVEIVDRVDELRSKNKAASQPYEPQQQHPIVPETKEVARIQYFGFSYGTVLGNTFASMFPGRVGRLIIDGVDDANDYMKGVSDSRQSPFLRNLHMALSPETGFRLTRT